MDTVHVSMQDTLRGIRERAGRSQEGLAAYLEVDLPRLQRFEAATLSGHEPGDQELVDVYGRLVWEWKRP